MTAGVTTLSILVVDDEEGIRSLLVRWLEERGHKVTTAENAQEATRRFTQERFDLVITDVVMPNGDGFELIAAFRKAQPGARILAISGGGKYLEGGDCLRIARGLGAQAVVMKPFTRQQLQIGIDQALGTTPSQEKAAS
jgi:two-component system chemotaxis response regulator CheY